MQQRENQGSLLIYNASAGSGKTYTLVKEYLRIILRNKNGDNFKKVLAMTFTNKAANEMKERVLDKLIQLSKPAFNKSEEDLKEAQNFAQDFGCGVDDLTERAENALNKILHNYGMFSVMTIDKFTHKVIRTFSKELGLSLDFDVELDVNTLRKNVTDLLFDQIGRDKDLTQLMVQYANANLQDEKSWNFKEELYKFSDALFKEDAISAIQKLKNLSSTDFLQIRKDISEEQRKIEQKQLKIASDALALIKANNLQEEDFTWKKTGAQKFFDKMAEGRRDHDSGPSARQLNIVAEGTWGHIDSPNKGLVDSLAPELENYFNQLVQFIDEQLPTYILNKEILKNLNNLSLMNHMLNITEQIKKEENVLLISDFYKKISEIIIEEPVPFIYERLGVRYEHFLLDEFQDTSNLQWINLVPLLHNSLASKHTNLIVGDGKQAIYRWRNGEVEQFINLPEKIENPNNIESLAEAQATFINEGVKINLESNYRSAAEIINFNNAFFDFAVQTIGSEYIKKIYTDGSQQVQKDFKGYVEINSSDAFEKDLQNEYCKEVVERVLAQNYQLKDICFLVRKNKDGSKIANYLSEQGYPIISKDSLFVGKDLHVKFLSSLLAAIVSPKNKNYRKKCLEHYVNIFMQDAPPQEQTSLLNAPQEIRSVFTQLDIEIVPHEEFQSFYEYVEFLLDAFKLKIEDNAYLQYFLEQVHQFEKHSSTNIRAFIEWFTSKGSEASISSPEGANAIQVMSIHKAKGLQFPVVVCPYFDWDMHKNKSNVWIEDQQDHLPAYFLKPSQKTLTTKHSEVLGQEDTKVSLDQLNMIYVAFTRPETALFICGNTKNSGTSAIKNFIVPFMESGQLAFEDQGEFKFYGELHPKLATEEAEISDYKITFPKHKMDRTKFSLKGDWEVSFEELDSKRRYGTELHLVLSKIEQESDLQEVLMACLNKGLISPENMPRLNEDVQRLFKNAHFQSYFNAERIENERPIIDAEGRVQIPDRVIYRENEVIVVDFKSGEEHSEKYEKQLSDYVLLLQDIGYSNVRGELFYTESCQVKSVAVG
ncbi:MAG: UvrD-helicase domain-containing protein [Crocinitomicaceae bacterium]